MNTVTIPETFASTMRSVYGEEGGPWLERLPAIIAECEQRWDLRAGEPFAPLSYNYVTRARRADGTTVVLKAGFPCRELRTEVEALCHFGGRGSVLLLEADVELGAFVLEQLEPGNTLEVNEDEAAAMAAAAGVMRQLWHPPPAGHSFPSVADWGRGFERLRAAFDGGTGPYPEALVREAEDLYASLLASSAQPVVLHGDLHHGNILAAGRQPWLAIDPKGVTGEPAYEAGALLRNPRPGLLSAPGARATLARRSALLSEELGIDRERLRGWSFAQAVLSAWWTYEDHGEPGQFALSCAELLRED
ncbi:MAG: aminoglycoside phosphotransferase family protein [Tepidiformaceae bacterium]